MNRISARSIQVFVAGAIALMSFQSLLLLPYFLAVSKDLIFVLSSIISGFALWIAIAMFFGSKKGIWWANVYLWLCSISSAGMACIYGVAASDIWKPLPHATWRGLSHLPIPVILLWLLIWSRSRRFQDQPTPDTASEPRRKLKDGS